MTLASRQLSIISLARSRFWVGSALLVIATLGLCTTRAAEKMPPPMRILVPAYFYPGGNGLKEWDRLLRSQNPSAIVVIVNPASGPGAAADPNYVAIIERARKAGITLIGYITTSYGKRSLDAMKADVDQWLKLYPGIGGIFFDEQASGTKEVDKQAALYDYVRKTRRLELVIANPGTICDEAYLSRPAADSVCLFEGPRAADSLRFPRWTAHYKPSQLTALPYKVATAEQMRACLREAVQNRVGIIYVTDADGSMPWDRLPRYWEEELEVVHTLNNERR